MSAPDTVTGVLRHVFTWPDRVLLRDWSSAVESSPHVEVLGELVQRYVALRRHAPGWSPRRYDRNNHRHIPNDDVVALLLDAKRIDKGGDRSQRATSRRTEHGGQAECVVCRQAFRAIRRSARYCSESCKQKAKRRRESGSEGGQSAERGTGGPHTPDTLRVQDGASERPNPPRGLVSARSSTEEVVALADTFREPLTAPEWARAVEEVGSPAELASELYERGLLVGPVLARAVPTTWSLSDSPLRVLGHERWRELFAATGFTIDGVPAPPPPRPVVLYRGASHLRRRGWSWTPDLSIAARFALRHGLKEGGVAHIFSAVVPPTAMLAAMSPGFGAFPGEFEVVADTAGLTIQLQERNAYRRMAGAAAW